MSILLASGAHGSHRDGRSLQRAVRLEFMDSQSSESRGDEPSASLFHVAGRLKLSLPRSSAAFSPQQQSAQSQGLPEIVPTLSELGRESLSETQENRFTRAGRESQSPSASASPRIDIAALNTRTGASLGEVTVGVRTSFSVPAYGVTLRASSGAGLMAVPEYGNGTPEVTTQIIAIQALNGNVPIPARIDAAANAAGELIVRFDEALNDCERNCAEVRAQFGYLWNLSQQDGDAWTLTVGTQIPLGDLLLQGRASLGESNGGSSLFFSAGGETRFQMGPVYVGASAQVSGSESSGIGYLSATGLVGGVIDPPRRPSSTSIRAR